MGRDVIALAGGTVLFIAGLMMMRAHGRAWALQKSDSTLSAPDRAHFYRRYRRRMQTSALLAVLGLLVAFGERLLPQVAANLLADPRRQMVFISLYWIVILLMTAWVMLLGLGDLWSTRAHARVALERIRGEQRDLERQVAEIRRRANGHHDQSQA